MQKTAMAWKFMLGIFFIIMTSQNAVANQLRAINIEFVEDQSQTIIPGLKAQYRLCIQKKESILKTKREHPEIWPAMKSSLRPEYKINAGADPEPDWVALAVGKNVSREYFYGDNYARYSENSRYKISKDGLCRLIIDKREKREIDNGQHRYLINMHGYIQNRGSLGGASGQPPYQKIKVNRTVSPVISYRENDRELNNLVNNHPQVMQYINRLFDSGANRVSGSGGLSKATVDKLRDAFGIKEDRGDSNIQTPRANDEHFVLGNACDIVTSKNLNTRLWYWQRMHHYPTVMRRPIILKSEVKMGNRIATKVATRFLVQDSIDPRIFSPPQAKGS